MSAPRLRAKLAAPRTASDQTEEEKVKGKKGAQTDEEKEGSEEEQEKEGSEEEQEKEGSEDEERKDGKKATAASRERDRMKAITGSASAEYLPKLAAHLAYDTDLSAKQAEGVLKAALKDVDVGASDAPSSREAGDKSPKGDAFRQAMERHPNPKLGAGGGKAEPEDPWLAAAKDLGVA